MKISETLEVRDLFFDAQNGDKIELSSVLDKGTVGSVLKSNGNGTVQWGSDLTGGVNYTGSQPTVINGLTVYNGTDGSTIGDTILTTQDILDLQTDKLDKTGGVISSDLTVSGTLKIGQVSDNSFGLSGITFNNISRFNAGMRTTTFGNPSIGDVQLISDIDGNSRQLKNNNAVYTDNLYSKAGLGNIKINNGNLDFQNINNIQNLNNLEVTTLSANNGSSIGLNDDINVNNYDLNSVNEIKTNIISTNTSPDVNMLSPLDMNNNNITKVNNISTDNLTSSTTDKILLNNDLDFQNTYNLRNISLINNIQPSGGLYSESSGFITASLTEINILGQGSNSGSLSIPANEFISLSMYSFKASGVLTGGTNDLFTLRANTLTSIPSTILLGEIMVTLQDNGLVNVPWDIMIDFTVRNTGIANTASLVLSGAFRYNNNNDVVRTFLRTIVLTTGFDTTIDNTLQLTFQNDGTNPLTSFRIDQASFTKWY
jgi:hypothetical protein